MKVLTLCLKILVFSGTLTAQPPLVLFPGDTNNDGSCNYQDLFPIGLNYNQQFEPRPNPSQNWIPQIFLSWPQELPVSRVNSGFSDCDGNGLIDDLDLDAIQTNYDEIQIGSIPPPDSWLKKLTDTLFSTQIPIITLFFDRDTAFTGDTVFAFLNYQIPPNHPTDAMGLGLWLSYLPGAVKDLETRVLPDTLNPDLMFVASVPAKTSIWRTVSPGNIQFGACGRGQNELEGTGILAAIRIIIEDKIFAREIPFEFQCEEFILLNAAEQVIPSIFLKDTVIIKKRTTSVKSEDETSDQISVFPNPASGWIFIKSEKSTLEQIFVFDQLGKLVLSSTTQNQEIKLDISNLPAAIYNLLVQTEKGIFRRLFFKK